MGYIKRKLDFSDRWYPSGVLWRYVYMFILYDLGFILIMFMMVDERVDYLGLSTDHTPLGRALLYLFVGMLVLLLVMFSLAGVSLIRLTRIVKGMVVRDFTRSIESTERTIEGLFDTVTLEVVRVDRSKRPGWRRWPNFFQLSWIRSKGTGLEIAVVHTGMSRRTSVFVKHLDNRNQRSVERLQSIIDASLLKRDDIPDGPPISAVQAEAVGDGPQSEKGMELAYTDSPRIRM